MPDPLLMLGCGVVAGLLASFLFRRQPAPRVARVSALPLADVPVAVVRCDASFRVLSCNDGLRELLGYPPEVVRGLTLPQLALDDERLRVRRRLAAVSGPPGVLQVRCRRVDGEPQGTTWYLRAGQDGTLIVVIVSQNLDGRADLGRLSAALREPLMAIVGTADQLAEVPVGPALRDSVHTITRSALQLTQALDAMSVATNSAGTTLPPSRSRHAPSTMRVGRRVLVVEDHAVNASVLQRSLRRLGVQSELATNGRVALEMLASHTFDAVLMDCQMPVMDGYEATRRIRENPSTADLPVIAVTAHAMEGDRVRCLSAGMDDHLTKPVRLESLRAALQEWTGPFTPNEIAASARTVDPVALGTLRDLLGDDFQATVRLFLADTEQAISVAEQAFLAGDWAELSRRVHSLKSTSAYVGASELSDTCERLVRAARTQQSDAVPSLLQHLRACFLVARGALLEIISDLSMEEEPPA